MLSPMLQGQFVCKEGHPVERPQVIQNKVTGNFFVGLQCDKCKTDYAMTDETSSQIDAMRHLKHLLEEVEHVQEMAKARIEEKGLQEEMLVDSGLLATACMIVYEAPNHEEMLERLANVLMPMLTSKDMAFRVIAAMVTRGRKWEVFADYPES